MPTSFPTALILVLIVACNAETTNPSSDSTTSTASSVDSAVVVDTTIARTETTETSKTAATDPTTPDRSPSYEVFLAAVAEPTVGTRFAEVPFDEPEITVATGLALCEAIADGESPDDIIVEFLADPTDGLPGDADNDQLVLTGALIGAAESALCPDDL